MARADRARQPCSDPSSPTSRALSSSRSTPAIGRASGCGPSRPSRPSRRRSSRAPGGSAGGSSTSRAPIGSSRRSMPSAFCYVRCRTGPTGDGGSPSRLTSSTSAFRTKSSRASLWVSASYAAEAAPGAYTWSRPRSASPRSTQDGAATRASATCSAWRTKPTTTKRRGGCPTTRKRYAGSPTSSTFTLTPRPDRSGVTLR